MKYPGICFLVLIQILTSCAGETESYGYTEIHNLRATVPEAGIWIVERSLFHRDLFLRGRVHSKNRTICRSPASSFIIGIKVISGDVVAKGDTLMVLDTSGQHLRIKAAELGLKKAMIDLADLQIMNGRVPDPNSIAEEQFMIESGYSKAKIDYQIAISELNKMVLISPMNGKVEEICTRPHEYINMGDPVCTIDDGKEYYAEIPVLPKQLNLLKKNMAAELHVPGEEDNAISGKVSYLSDYIDEDGLGKIRITLGRQNKFIPDGSLIVAKVLIPRDSGVVIPKSAMVIRSGKHVAFVYCNGRAKWRNISIKDENSSFYYIEEGLDPGDSLIVSGNVFLAHEAPVKAIFSPD